MSLTQDTFAFVADVVRRRSAIQLEAGKEYLVESRLLPLARDAGHPGVDAYVREVRARGREADLAEIVEALTTNETSWFRDATPFSALRTHMVPALRADRPVLDSVRVWSAACSTGQEPYSLAMTLADVLGPGVRVDITATDLSEQVLAQARSGRYSQLEVNRGLPAPMLVRHFQRSGTDWQISEALRRAVTFQKHNLLDLPPAGPFDIVFLRNVLIYFDLATKRSILSRVHRVLKPGGFLVLGAAETTIGVDGDWERMPVERGSVYRPVHAGLVPSPRPAPAAAASAAPFSRPAGAPATSTLPTTRPRPAGPAGAAFPQGVTR
ncbi:chemotaxis protein methyltransferase [Cellulomonas hominis]|uniref:protein-glutamate O-methyltransferase n=1 Tax=Cellulomonas hominis TaxID=156981 RepID=A0A511FG78_9CELL|nr:protein-glutamate O-methyltransferase CheR [Cellulomonas hominis]MBB5472175.1 chemotaxis protein methyltransferase CheR [Cellulomonas hominis]GEL47327.1 chemotaxis protein methyltransferase [Cellulomonas hominis]